MDANELLLYEHKIIFSLLKKLQEQIAKIKKESKIQGNFIDLLTDFFMTYIDVYHHGKEENLMFERLKSKNISKNHKETMELLVEQHNIGRKMMEKTINLSAEYFKGRTTLLEEIVKILEDFHDLYVEHAKLEDTSFFKEAMQYFNKSEKEQLLQDFFKFNIKMTDEKYKSLIEMI